MPGDRKSELEAEIWLENSGLDNFIVGRAFTNQAKKTDMKQKLKLHHASTNWMCWPNKNLIPGALVNIKVKDDSQTRNIFLCAHCYLFVSNHRDMKAWSKQWFSKLTVDSESICSDHHYCLFHTTAQT